MGFRTVVVNSRCKLEFRLNFLIIRSENEKRIFINEINTLIVQSTAVSLTVALLSELIHNNVKVIFCDEKCNPLAELLPYYGAHNTSKKIKTQIRWKNDAKGKVWKTLIRKKILNQAEVLRTLEYVSEAELLESYIAEVMDGDVTNREGHAAKVYFNCILPNGSTRRNSDFINGCLNYGYAVLLSAINREIVASGYVTQLGIWHDNEFNEFNLGSDLIEPLRTVVDQTAINISENDKLYKRKMANVLNYETIYADKQTTLDVAVRLYVKSVLSSLETNDETRIVFPEKIIIQ